MHAHVSNKEIPALRSVFCRNTSWIPPDMDTLFRNYTVTIRTNETSLLEINRSIL